MPDKPMPDKPMPDKPMPDNTERLLLLISERRIRARIATLARRIDANYRGRTLCLVVVLKGAFVFAADLARQLATPSTTDFISAASGIPDPDQAIVEDRKIIHYLLSSTHPAGRAKALFFRRFGLRASAGQRLRDALLDHARSADIVSVSDTPFGKKYTVEGPLMTPGARNPRVRSVWFVATGETAHDWLPRTRFPELSDDQGTGPGRTHPTPARGSTRTGRCRLGRDGSCRRCRI
jgi:hypothetical protein